MLDETVPALPADRPRYLMGVGKPADHRRRGDARHRHVRLRAADALGPHGQAFTRRGTVNLRNARHADDPRPLDDALRLPGLHALFSRAYLHHLVKANEILASMLLTWHNLRYYQAA